MDNTDQSFQDEYKPVTVPAHFNKDDSWRNKVVYALSQLGSATASEVANELGELEDSVDPKELQQQANVILTNLFDKGLIKGSPDEQDQLVYNLSKMTETNTGEHTDADQR